MDVQRAGSVFSLGPLASTVLDRAKWAGRDEWPASPMIADEAERLFSFALSRDVFGLYLSRMCSRRSQRDSAIEELRVAYFLDRNDFRVVEWSPIGNAGREGEFIARCPQGEDVFVEVKSPGWESELSEGELLDGRGSLEKYLPGDGRAIDNAPAIARSATAHVKINRNRSAGLSIFRRRVNAPVS